jgi:hypothetical protein
MSDNDIKARMARMREHVVKLVLVSELHVPYDPEDMSKTNSIAELLAQLVRPQSGGYAVCGVDGTKYTASLRVTEIKSIDPACPFCGQSYPLLPNIVTCVKNEGEELCHSN